MKQITAEKSAKNLGDFLLEKYPLLTFGKLNKFLRENKIKLNGKKTPLSTPVQKGDEIKLFVPDAFFEKITAENRYTFCTKDIEIVYEDENLLAVNKPAGIAVYDENFQNYDTLINRVKKHYSTLSATGVSPALCHRLDTGTCGLVLVAKNRRFLEFMTEVFKNHLLEKTYVCAVKGKPAKKQSVYKAFLTKDSRAATVKITLKPINSQSKNIETAVRHLDSYGDYSMLEVGLITGRTHQIRAHLSFLSMPILGDSRYGINSLNRSLKLKYQLLCAQKLRFSNIDNDRYSYLSNLEIRCPDPWFIKAFENREF